MPSTDDQSVGAERLMWRAVERMLAANDITPVLVDVGAAGAPPQIWQKIASVSTLVSAEADGQANTTRQSARFQRRVLIRKAIVADDRDRCDLYVTRFRECSSTLAPNSAELASFAFSKLFTTERTITIPSTTLDAVLNDAGLPFVDWLKLDTQGTDLRLLQSLSAERRLSLLAVDVEPGFINAYHGEDLFTRTHDWMIANGFWLSRAVVQGSQRISESVREELGISGDGESKGRIAVLRSTPAWVEARYMRRTDWLEENNQPAHRYVSLGALALLDGQAGHTAEVALAYRRSFGDDATARRLLASAEDRMRPSQARALLERLSRSARRTARRIVRDDRLDAAADV